MRESIGQSDMDAPPVRGGVEYEIRDDGSLIGTWSFAGFNGQIGLEWATGGKPGVIEGGYEVHIYNARGKNVFHGALEVVREGGTYQMKWVGDDNAVYYGIGMKVGSSRLAAAYWNE